MMRVKEKLKITDYGNAGKEFGQEERCPEPRVPNDQIGAKAAAPRLHPYLKSAPRVAPNSAWCNLRISLSLVPAVT